MNYGINNSIRRIGKIYIYYLTDQKTISNPLKRFLRLLIKTLHAGIVFIINPFFYLHIRKYRNNKKIIYAITPPSSLKNVGDHAQVVAINKWLNDNFKDYSVMEFDKNEMYLYIPSIKKITNENDLIFLHSGGNLGDRSFWSENIRRSIIKNFPENKIISLPQTIFFNDTKVGREELEITKNIYNDHRDLTIIARDSYSFKLAKEYFSSCKNFVCPDFVLYLKRDRKPVTKRKNILLCIRNDTESIIDDETRQFIANCLNHLGKDYTFYDTTLDRNIAKENREKELERSLSLFESQELVITDRFHGVIFSVITKTPCIALKTIDHKLSESIKWFEDINYVTYTEDFTTLPDRISKMLEIDGIDTVDWRSLYFDGLRSKIFSEDPGGDYLA